MNEPQIVPQRPDDEQWEILGPLLPAAKPGGRPRTVDLREVVNGILYLLRSGCPWRMVPHDLPPWQTLYILPQLDHGWNVGTSQ